MEQLTWQRFVLDEDKDESGEERFAELARQGATIFVRKGRRTGEPRIEIQKLASEAAAKRGLDGRIRMLRRQGYLEDGQVLRPAPLPEEDTRSSRAADRELGAAMGSEIFEERLPTFAREWEALGFDPTLSFLDEARRQRVHPKVVAERCLELAASVFRVHFTRRTRTYDDEHGSAQSVPGYLLVKYYQSPANVLALARCKLRGQSGSTDDHDAPGLTDELLIRLRNLSNSHS